VTPRSLTWVVRGTNEPAISIEVRLQSD